ncbi:hypothetical protein L1987_33114 [Smallanthus sonchifolius]|uniref:Uncharacterized protein n=1 Tax=Smallanthus sonchifolius TaxID=185202 RepID=A0ACB9HQ56_9ASTR|nr:hypothetical protein L1987_33114 [Smallanthus sonchifolius]
MYTVQLLIAITLAAYFNLYPSALSQTYNLHMHKVCPSIQRFVCSVTEQENRIDEPRTLESAKESTIAKAAAQLLRDIMPAAIANAMKDVGKMLGKTRWVRIESDEEPKQETLRD